MVPQGKMPQMRDDERASLRLLQNPVMQSVKTVEMDTCHCVYQFGLLTIVRLIMTAS